MVLGNASDEWRHRLAALRAARRTPASDVEVWLIEIRIRILEYLVRRYGDDSRRPRFDDRGPGTDSVFRRGAAPRHLESTEHWDGVEHPPLGASAMRPVLRRIRDDNQFVRLRCGRPGPDMAWSWFVETYCRAGSTKSSGTLAGAD